MLAARGVAGWTVCALALVAAPAVFDSGRAVAILSQMGITIVFCLAYNMLLGQGGMLSFGHAAFYGLGSFFAIHAMNLASAGRIWLPLPLVPLAGALAGMLLGVLLGSVITRRAGTSFAMITFGIGELAFVSAAMFPQFFGGETGLGGDRVYGEPWLGLTFGPALQVYYLIAFWVLVGAAAMHWFTRTPLGRIINAVRDNPERVAFIGFSAWRARYLTLVASGLFAGLAGGLAAINFEIATVENLGAAQSGTVLLFTFIGGAGHFAGPIIGAIVGTLLTLLVSGVSKAWPLYLGLFFVLVVKFAPGGIAGLAVGGWRLARSGAMAGLWPWLLLAVATGLAASAGAVVIVEMLYRRTIDTAAGSGLRLFGLGLDTASPRHWAAAIAFAAVAGLASWRAIAALRRRQSLGTGDTPAGPMTR